MVTREAAKSIQNTIEPLTGFLLKPFFVIAFKHRTQNKLRDTDYGTSE